MSPFLSKPTLATKFTPTEELATLRDEYASSCALSHMEAQGYLDYEDSVEAELAFAIHYASYAEHFDKIVSTCREVLSTTDQYEAWLAVEGEDDGTNLISDIAEILNKEHAEREQWQKKRN